MTFFQAIKAVNRIAAGVTFSRLIAEERRAYKLHPTHQPTSAARALKELGQGIRAMDRQTADRRAQGLGSFTKRIWGKVTGAQK